MRRNLRDSSRAKRWVPLLACGVLVVAMTGCAMIPTIQRKFTRKKKYQGPPAVAVTTRTYDEHLAPEERYQRHFALWNFWHDEILEGLGEGRKKAIRAVEESIGELQVLQSLLTPPKAGQLAAHIAQLERLRTELVQGTLTQMGVYRWRSDLERQKRVIHQDFA